MDPLRLGVLGGTFDPIHIGHLILAEYSRQKLELEMVIFVPAGAPWRKTGRFVAPAVDRLEMVRRAVGAFPEYGVSTVEIDATGPSYTAETLEQLSGQYKGWEMFLLMGQDALADLPNWHRPEVIVGMAVLAVARRRGFEGVTGVALEGRIAGISNRIRWLEMPAIDISASDIRQRVRAGRSIRFLVPSAVEEYIQRHGLYVGG